MLNASSVICGIGQRQFVRLARLRRAGCRKQPLGRDRRRLGLGSQSVSSPAIQVSGRVLWKNNYMVSFCLLTTAKALQIF